MYCAYCGKEIQSDSIFCRHCGKEQEPASSVIAEEIPKNIVSPSQTSSSVQQQASSVKNKRIYHALEILIFILGFVAAIYFKGGTAGKNLFHNVIPNVFNKVIPRENYIQLAAKNIVSKEAVSPSSIKWKVVEVLEEDDYGRYIVDVQLESKNQFGVIVPSYVIVVLYSVNEDGSCKYHPIFGVTDYENEALKSVGVELAKRLNQWNTPIESSKENGSLGINTNNSYGSTNTYPSTDSDIPETSINTSQSTNNDIPETSSNTYPSVVTDLPTDNKSLSDIQILSILEKASFAEYNLYTSFDDSTRATGMVKLLPEFETAEKIDTYLRSYWSDEDIKRIKREITFKDGIAYVPYGDPSGPKEFTQGEVVGRKFIDVCDDDKNVIGDELRVTVELTVYGELETFWYEVSYDNTTSSWRVMTLY